MSLYHVSALIRTPSPSTRRAWIEMLLKGIWDGVYQVALHPEGVDRNPRFAPLNTMSTKVALHPEGVDRNLFAVCCCLCSDVALHPEGVDRNSRYKSSKTTISLSPSTRRAWIEIFSVHRDGV